MATPIYLLVIFKGNTEAWHQLPKEEQDALWAKAMEIDKRVGVEWHISCDSRWADEEI